MVRRILKSTFFFLLLIALILYFMGVRQVNLWNGADWIRSIAFRFTTLNGIRISDIPEWVVELSSNPSFWETVSYYLTFVVNFFVGLYNVVIAILNTVIDIVKFIICIVWCIVDSPSYLVQ